MSFENFVFPIIRTGSLLECRHAVFCGGGGKVRAGLGARVDPGGLRPRAGDALGEPSESRDQESACLYEYTERKFRVGNPVWKRGPRARKRLFHWLYRVINP